MKTRSLAIVLFLFTLNSAFSQVVKENYPRFIEVMGSAEKTVKPDQILFVIGLQEYFKEEYEAGKDYKDYVTKISLDEIEKTLIAELLTLGVTKEQISITEGGNYSVSGGKNYMKTKTIQLMFSDFNKINELIQKVKSKGVSYMRIEELKNKDIAKNIKLTKIDAMKDAKDKATYLLESVGSTVGPVLSVVEMENVSSNYLSGEEMYNKTTANSSIVQNDPNNQNLVLKYKIKVRFEIK